MTLPAISLFLYALSGMSCAAAGPIGSCGATKQAYRRPNPVRVNYRSFGHRVGPSRVPSPEQDEHRLLGAAMLALLRHRELPASALRGALAGSDKPVRTSVLHGEHVRSVADFWKVFGGKPRPSFLTSSSRWPST